MKIEFAAHILISNGYLMVRRMKNELNISRVLKRCSCTSRIKFSGHCLGKTRLAFLWLIRLNPSRCNSRWVSSGVASPMVSGGRAEAEAESWKEENEQRKERIAKIERERRYRVRARISLQAHFYECEEWVKSPRTRNRTWRVSQDERHARLIFSMCFVGRSMPISV